MARLVSNSALGWTASRPATDERRAAWPAAIAQDPTPQVAWAVPAGADKAHLANWAVTVASDSSVMGVWGQAQAVSAYPIRALWVISARADAARKIDGVAAARGRITAVRWVPWGLTSYADAGARIEGSGGNAAIFVRTDHRSPWGRSAAVNAQEWLPWGMGRVVDSGIVVITPPPDPDEPDSTLIIPTLRAYIVINSASLSRVSNNLALPAFGLSMSIDDRGAHWTWSASLPLAALADIEPDAPGQLVELEAVVNGCVFRLFIQSVQEREAFLGSGLAIGGRGLAAELSAPNYPVSAHNNIGGAMTAQQLAAEALSINGVPLGWSLDWQAADWLVPAGVWLHSGTPLDAVVTLAATAGAYVQADPAARALHVLPRYPVAPWDWSTATPAVVLPASAVLDRGTEHVIGAGYNVVYVSGQEQGIRARVKRIGTAGDVPAEMIVDRLITHADPARGRGVEVLGQGGSRQVTTLETGVLPEAGLLHVGTLMDWTRGGVARRGLVRRLSVSVSVPGGQSRDPIKVRQTVEVETHG